MPKDPRSFEHERKEFKAVYYTLVVGMEEKEYSVHEGVLCKSSPFFHSATRKEWKEGQERRVVLPDDAPSIVDLYLQWLYTDKILSRKLPEENEQSTERGTRNTVENSLLIGGFVFGEKIQDGNFKDAIIDALIHSVSAIDVDGRRWFPAAESVDIAYQGTPEGSQLRRLLLDMHICHGDSKWTVNQKNVEFLADLAGRLLDEKGSLMPPDFIKINVSSCQYHHHTHDYDCHSAGRAKRVKRDG
ncbi:hypothetical protein Q7P37_011332 [Cladosporium fusiforme]